MKAYRIKGYGASRKSVNHTPPLLGRSGKSDSKSPHALRARPQPAQGQARLLGFFPGYDRELVAPGVVKRVYQAVYAKLLAPEDKVLRPDPTNMTPRTKELYELLFPD